MIVRIPKSKRLVAVASQQGIITAVWDADDKDPAKPDHPPIVFEFVRHFLGQTLLSDPSWGKDMASVYMAEEIRGAFRHKKQGAQVELPRAHWERLVAVMETPAAPYNVPMMGLALDFFGALKGATEKPG